MLNVCRNFKLRRVLVSALLCALSIAPPARAVEVGEIFVSDSGETYSIEKRLGQGHFGSAWVVENPLTNERFAAKFFVTRRLKKITIETYKMIAKLQSEGKLKYLVQVHVPEKFAPVSAKQRHNSTVVRLALAQNNLEHLATTHFDLATASTLPAKLKRLRFAHRVMTDVLGGLLELRSLRLNHHDLNPRNILWTKDGARISDLDEIRKDGVRPSLAAHESHSSPLEYNNPDHPYDDAGTSDMHQIGNTLYRLLFGVYRMDETQSSYKAWCKDDVWVLRRLLFQEGTEFLQKLDALFIRNLQARFDREFPDSRSLPSNDKKMLAEMLGFLSASMRYDYDYRGDALSRLEILKPFKFHSSWRMPEPSTTNAVAKPLTEPPKLVSPPAKPPLAPTPPTPPRPPVAPVDLSQKSGCASLFYFLAAIADRL